MNNFYYKYKDKNKINIDDIYNDLNYSSRNSLFVAIKKMFERK